MANDIKNVFISHIHEDDEGLGNLKKLVAEHGLEVRDGSINSQKPNAAKDPDYIKQNILAPQIEWASTLVVYVTPDTKDSEWVNWEIEYANKLNKRIVGVWAHGENECDLPAALEQYADAVVGWHGESIVDAIIGTSNKSYDIKGKLREYRPIKRFKC
ncbi:MAG: TIR domain-containing protein [Nitrospira sp.]|nr:TIR domain-containing protein [Nitrospira sp.]